MITFDKKDYCTIYFLNEKKKCLYKFFYDVKHVKEFAKRYDKNQIFIPFLGGYNDWIYQEETQLIEPLKWEMHEKKLYMINDFIQGKVIAKTNCIIEFKNIKNKNNKIKKFNIEIRFDVNILSEIKDDYKLLNNSIIFINVKGDSRMGFRKNDDEYHTCNTYYDVKFNENTGDIKIDNFPITKEALYIQHMSAFIANKCVIDEIYKKFIEVCNTIAIDSKNNYLNMKTKLISFQKGI